MQPTTTHKICDNFGHNFYRIKDSSGSTDIIKCKHCEIRIKMNGNGDYVEMPRTNQLVHNLMKKLFLLRRSNQIQESKPVFNI